MKSNKFLDNCQNKTAFDESEYLRLELYCNLHRAQMLSIWFIGFGNLWITYILVIHSFIHRRVKLKF